MPTQSVQTKQSKQSVQTNVKTVEGFVDLVLFPALTLPCPAMLADRMTAQEVEEVLLLLKDNIQQEFISSVLKQWGTLAQPTPTLIGNTPEEKLANPLVRPYWDEYQKAKKENERIVLDGRSSEYNKKRAQQKIDGSLSRYNAMDSFVFDTKEQMKDKIYLLINDRFTFHSLKMRIRPHDENITKEELIELVLLERDETMHFIHYKDLQFWLKQYHKKLQGVKEQSLWQDVKWWDDRLVKENAAYLAGSIVNNATDTFDENEDQYKGAGFKRVLFLKHLAREVLEDSNDFYIKNLFAIVLERIDEEKTPGSYGAEPTKSLEELFVKQGVLQELPESFAYSKSKEDKDRIKHRNTIIQSFFYHVTKGLKKEFPSVAKFFDLALRYFTKQLNQQSGAKGKTVTAKSNYTNMFSPVEFAEELIDKYILHFKYHIYLIAEEDTRPNYKDLITEGFVDSMFEALWFSSWEPPFTSVQKEEYLIPFVSYQERGLNYGDSFTGEELERKKLLAKSLDIFDQEVRAEVLKQLKDDYQSR